MGPGQHISANAFPGSKVFGITSLSSLHLSMGPAWSSVGPVWDRRRVLTAAGVAGGHLTLLWLVLYFSSFAAPLLVREHTLAAVEIADVPSTSAPAKPSAASPIPVLDPPVLMPSAIKVPAAPAASSTGTGAGCGMAGVIGRAIAADPAAMEALDALPPGIRTEADAVMLWNGGWIDVGGAPTAAPMPVTVQKLLPPILQNDPLAPLKQTVVAAIAAVPPVCQDLGVTGPQLIPIAEPGRTTMLVIGSGMWKWTELINPAIIPAESGHLDIQQAGSPSQKMDLPRLVTDRHPIVNGP